MDVLITYSEPLARTYGELYHKVARSLSTMGYDVQTLNLQEFIATYDFDDTYLRTLPKAKLVLSHSQSLETQLLAKVQDQATARVMRDEVEQYFITSNYGSIQSDNPSNASTPIEGKIGLIRTLQNSQIPIPESILKEDEPFTYEYLSQKLNTPFVAKDVTSHRARGVHLITKENAHLLENPNIQVAQKKITTSNPPSSLRIITTPNNILGYFVYYNPFDSLRSNLGEGYRRLFPFQSYNSYSSEELALLKHNGIKTNLLRQDIQDLALKVSNLPSQSLLKGFDIIFDQEENPFLLEAQTNPSSAQSTVYQHFLGQLDLDSEQNIDRLAHHLALQFSQLLQN